MDFVKVDNQGRIYLPKVVRETVGIKPDSVLELTATKGKITLSVRGESVAESGRGVFKITRSIEDVDKEIRERSLQRALGELSEIRGR
ncbi:MAG: AbrB/MazE/SpoVT family DNA-binding domain-containing protein [Candidatus Geothermarchaeales archaeon]